MLLPWNSIQRNVCTNTQRSHSSCTLNSTPCILTICALKCMSLIFCQLATIYFILMKSERHEATIQSLSKPRLASQIFLYYNVQLIIALPSFAQYVLTSQLSWACGQEDYLTLKFKMFSVLFSSNLGKWINRFSSRSQVKFSPMFFYLNQPAKLPSAPCLHPTRETQQAYSQCSLSVCPVRRELTSCFLNCSRTVDNGC